MHDLMPSQATLLCSVVIPVYNGATVITRCLDALADQTLTPDRYELLVVDDGSTDATAAVVERWRLAHPRICLALLQQANAGPAAARNRGAEHANAPLIFFTDADCAPTGGATSATARPINVKIVLNCMWRL